MRACFPSWRKGSRRNAALGWLVSRFWIGPSRLLVGSSRRDRKLLAGSGEAELPD